MLEAEMTAEILFTSCLILHMREESLRGQEPVQGGAANGRVGMRIQAIPGILRYCQSLLIKAERRFFSVNPFTCDILALFADFMKSVNPRDNQEFEPQEQFDCAIPGQTCCYWMTLQSQPHNWHDSLTCHHWAEVFAKSGQLGIVTLIIRAEGKASY